jgi:outer membrane lipoprotein carrier protein
LLLSSSAGNTVFAQTKDEVAQSIEGHYRDLVDLTAKVVQKNNLKTLGKIQTFEGALFIKKPGRLRLEYTNGQTIVLDGKTVWFHSKKSQQAIKRTFMDIEQANVPVAFLLGAAEIRSDFDVVQPEVGGQRTIELFPKKPGAAMKKLRLHSEESGRITAMTIFDKSGNTTEITFADVTEGTGMEDKLFEFKVPKGTEVIEQ